MQSAAIYIRVSTDDQLEYSPEAQKRAIFDYAARNDMYISPEHIYADEGISGRRADKRPQFQKMINAAKSKPRPFDIILVHKFDRFARSREDSIVYKSMLLRECGVKVTSITEDLSDDKTSVILEAMLEAMGEYYSLNLSEEVKKGMTIKAERGEIQTSPPIGYTMDKENKKMVINKKEADIVKFIFKEFLGLSTVSGIAKRLNLTGIKTKRGKHFTPGTVYYILNNPVYTGKVRWTPTGRTKFDFNNPDTIISKSNHEPIITEEDFAAANKIIESRKKIYPKYNKNHKYFLSGLIKCSSCGSNLTIAASRNGLQCYKYNNKICFVSHFIKISKFEKSLKEQLEHDSAIRRKEEKIEMKKNTDKSYNSDVIDKQIEKLNKKMERAAEAYLNEVYDIEYLKKVKKDISEEINVLEKQKKSKKAKETMSVSQTAKNALKIFDEKYSEEERRSIAESLIEKIVFNKSENCLDVYYKR